MAAQTQSKFLLMTGAIVIVAIMAYSVLTAPDRRDAGEKIGDAIDELGDRTTGERLSDVINDKD